MMIRDLPLEPPPEKEEEPSLCSIFEEMEWLFGQLIEEAQKDRL